jgi:hypothetical protein
LVSQHAETAAAPAIARRTVTAPQPGAGPLVLASPAPGTTAATANATITLVFAKPVAKVLGSTLPTISPAVAGNWSQPGPYRLVFTPTGFGFGPATTVTVSFNQPLRVVATMTTRVAAATTATTSYTFTVAPASVLRLEEILAQLQYLPLNFVPAHGVAEPTTLAGEVAATTQPPAGSFTWRWASIPAALQAEWTPDPSNLLVKGALMAFLANA